MRFGFVCEPDYLSLWYIGFGRGQSLLHLHVLFCIKDLDKFAIKDFEIVLAKNFENFDKKKDFESLLSLGFEILSFRDL